MLEQPQRLGYSIICFSMVYFYDHFSLFAHEALIFIFILDVVPWKGIDLFYDDSKLNNF